LYSKGEGYSLTNSGYPIYEFPKSAFMACFSGKASPARLCAMSQLISYWRGYKILKEGKDIGTVAEVVDKYLGVDCNGFIGNYLREKYAGITVGPSSTEYTFKVEGVQRASPMDFRADDVIVFDGFHHVAIIDSVSERTKDHATCLVCESRSKDHGGPQMRWYNLHAKKGKYGINGRDDIDCVVKIKGT
jgi:hypothetical protein